MALGRSSLQAEDFITREPTSLTPLLGVQGFQRARTPPRSSPPAPSMLTPL